MALKSPKLSWRRAFEPWFLAYILLGVTTGGMSSIFLPLAVIDSGNEAASVGRVGVVMAMIGVGQLTAGLWGTLADRFRLHRLLFVAGALMAALAFAGFAFSSILLAWVSLALLLGFGTSAANTMANLFIVECHPRGEWDARVGYLQTFYTGGVVAGLTLAGALSNVPVKAAMLTAAALTLLAMLIAARSTKTPARDAEDAHPHVTIAPVAEISMAAPLHIEHRLSMNMLRRIGPMLRSPFGIFLLIWLSSSLGIAAALSLYPLVMHGAFDIDSGSASLVMAIATALAVLVFAPVGKLQARIGATRVLQGGLLIRLVCLVLLVWLGLVDFPGDEWIAVSAVMVVVMTGSVLTISGTVITSALTALRPGEGMGDFNAVNALAGLSGSAMGGYIAGKTSYDAAWVMGAVGVGIGFLLSLSLKSTPTAATPPVTQTP